MQVQQQVGILQGLHFEPVAQITADRHSFMLANESAIVAVFVDTKKRQDAIQFCYSLAGTVRGGMV